MKIPLLSLSLSILAICHHVTDANFFGHPVAAPPSASSDVGARELSVCGSHHMPCAAAEPCCNSMLELADFFFFMSVAKTCLLLTQPLFFVFCS